MIDDKAIEEIRQDCDGQWTGDGRRKFVMGEYGFLIEVTPHAGRPRLEFRDDPARTAGALDDLLFGIIYGDRTDVEGLGVAKVVELNKTGGRARVETVWGEELDAALLELGYPSITRDPVVQGYPRAA